MHRVLEGIVRRGAPGAPPTFAEALAAPPAAVAWPDAAALRAIVRGVCARLVRETGLALPGLDRVLERQVAPLLESARRLAWPETGAALIAGAEVVGSLALPTANGERALAFRVDRVDAAGGRAVLTDFKTGRPFSTAKGEATRRRHLLRAVGRGEALQAVAYALAAGRGAEARYLFLRPDLDPDVAAATVRHDDGEFAAAFAAAVGAVASVWDQGAFFPRLEEPDGGDEPRRCSSCEVRDACLRGDSGARRRLALWAEANAERDGLGDAEAALLAVWRLHARRPAGGPPGSRRDEAPVPRSTRCAPPTPRPRRRSQTSFDRPLVLEAGAGTGKTAALVARVVGWCLGPGWRQAASELAAQRQRSGKGEAPAAERVAARVLDGVVAITFTEAAAAEMGSRVAQGLAEVERGGRPRGCSMRRSPGRTATSGSGWRRCSWRSTTSWWPRFTRSAAASGGRPARGRPPPLVPICPPRAAVRHISMAVMTRRCAVDIDAPCFSR